MERVKIALGFAFLHDFYWKKQKLTGLDQHPKSLWKFLHYQIMQMPGDLGPESRNSLFSCLGIKSKHSSFYPWILYIYLSISWKQGLRENDSRLLGY